MNKVLYVFVCIISMLLKLSSESREYYDRMWTLASTAAGLGNGEDGYLFGLTNLQRFWRQLRDQL